MLWTFGAGWGTLAMVLLYFLLRKSTILDPRCGAPNHLTSGSYLSYLHIIIIIIINNYKITHEPFTNPQILLQIQIPHLILPLAPHLYHTHIPYTFRVIDIQSSLFPFPSQELLQVLTSTSYSILHTTHNTYIIYIYIYT